MNKLPYYFFWAWLAAFWGAKGPKKHLNGQVYHLDGHYCHLDEHYCPIDEHYCPMDGHYCHVDGHYCHVDGHYCHVDGQFCCCWRHRQWYYANKCVSTTFNHSPIKPNNVSNRTRVRRK